MSDWQPIDSAPKDGTRVLLWDPDRLHNPHIGHWFQTGPGSGIWIWITDAVWQLNPTHWQPLPPPPAVSEPPKKEEKGKQ